MDNFVPHHEIAKANGGRSADFRSQHGLPPMTATGTTHSSTCGAHVGRNFRKHAIMVGGKSGALSMASDQLRSGDLGLEHILFDVERDEAGWTAELQAKLEDVCNRSWREQNVSIYLVRDGFTPEQFTAVLTGLQFIPRAIYLVSTDGGEGRATVRELQRPKFDRLQSTLKRAVDVLGCLGMMIFLAPLILVIALAIKLDSKGPVLFRQRRLGFLGRPFDIYKFRTMSVQENGDHVVQAQRHDPRVTRIGRFLRRSSIDELPQLLNVMKGDMSLVGPRPHAEAHDRHYSTIVPRYTFRRYVKPGMTGWAQVHGYRGQITSLDDIMQRIEFDGWYARNATILLDIRILFRTIAIVLNQKNAY